VWQRIEPLLIPEINKARDLRLQREGRYLGRRAVVLDQYVKFMKTLSELSPLLLALSPTFSEFLCGDRTLANVVALDNDIIGPGLVEQASEAISRLIDGLEIRRLERSIFLRSLLPENDAFGSATDEEVLGLATSVYECAPCHLRISGLHMLAHRCRGPQKHRIQYPRFSEEGRKTVEVLLGLLGLGEKTTALELDRRGDRFVCLRCPLLSFGGRGACVQGRYARDWRSCVCFFFLFFLSLPTIVPLTLHALQVAHATGPKQERSHKGGFEFHLVEESKTAGIQWCGDRHLAAYSCKRCPLPVVGRGANVEWRGLDVIKEHINQR
jgi:hypothetical protein